jgi:hypothetical protein
MWVSVYHLPESNRHGHHCPRDFKSLVSTCFTKVAFDTSNIVNKYEIVKFIF